MSSHDRASYAQYAKAMQHPGDFSGAVSQFFTQSADINVVHPFNDQKGADAYANKVLGTLQNAFEGLYRRDDIFMSGTFDGQNWISATGYSVGRFARDWIGIKATGKLSYLRYG